MGIEPTGRSKSRHRYRVFDPLTDGKRLMSAAAGYRLSSRRPWTAHDPQQVPEVFKLAQPTHSFSPFNSRFSGFETVDGFGLGATLSALVGLRAGPFA